MEHNLNEPADGGNLPPTGETQPYDTTMVGGSGSGNNKFAWIFVIIGAVLLAVIIVAVLWVTGVFGANATSGGGRDIVKEGNIGVWAMYDFWDQQQARQEALMSKAQKEMGERWLKEPFEFEGELEFDSELLETAGVPLSSINIDLDAKYDMKDLGVKLSMMGFVEVGAYLIEDEFVLDAMGDAGSVKIDLPFEVDMGDAMPLEERIEAFFPFLPEDDTIWMELFTKFAVAVPDELTEVDTEDVYSPLDEEEVEMTAITTKLDEDDLGVVLSNLIDGLREDEQLMDELQDTIDEFISFYGIEVDVDVDLEDGLDELEDKIKDISGEDFSFSWTVYERDGSYVGYSYCVNAEDMDMESMVVVEYDGNKGYAYSESNTEGTQKQWMKQNYTFEDEVTTFDMKGEVTIYDYTGEETKMEFEMFGTSEIEKTGKDEYEIIADISFEMDIGDIVSTDDLSRMSAEIPENISFDLTLEGNCLFGDNLGTLEDNKDWDDIYDSEWGDLEDMLFGMSGLGTMM